MLGAWRDSPAVRTAISIGVPTGLYGVSFGALAVAAGLSAGQAMALSLVMFTGGSQFAFVGVVGGGGALPSAIGAAALLGLRNAVYAVQMAAVVRPTGWRRLLATQLTIDESTAVALGQRENVEQRRGFWAAGGIVFVLWNAFTALGAVVGGALGDPRRWGLDGAAVAAFVGLLWPRLHRGEPVAVAVACAAVTLVAVPLVPPGIPILVAAAVAALVGLVRTGHREGEGLEPDLDPYPGGRQSGEAP